MATLKDKILNTLQRTFPIGGGASQVSVVHPYVNEADGGRFRLRTRSGLLTGVAADAILFAMRNPSSTKKIVVDYLKIGLVPVTDFTTTQELGAYLRAMRAVTVVPSTGGTAINLGTPNARMRGEHQASVLSNTGAFIANTGAITGGTVATEDAERMLEALGVAPSASTTTPNDPIEDVFVAADNGGPIVIGLNEGLVLRNSIALGAAGTVRLSLSMAWREVLNADAAGM